VTGPEQPSAGDTWNVFTLALTCGHLVTIARRGRYPVSVSCCDRLGGTIRGAVYVACSSNVDFAGHSDIRFRPTTDIDHWSTILLDRHARTDEPCPTGCSCVTHTAGRYPHRVGACFDFDAIPHRRGGHS
jgi:hypothetical protein